MLSVCSSSFLGFRGTPIARLGLNSTSISSKLAVPKKTNVTGQTTSLAASMLKKYHTTSSKKFGDGDFATRGRTTSSKLSSNEMSELLSSVSPGARSSSSRGSLYGNREDGARITYTSEGYTRPSSSRFAAGGRKESHSDDNSFDPSPSDSYPRKTTRSEDWEGEKRSYRPSRPTDDEDYVPRRSDRGSSREFGGRSERYGRGSRDSYGEGRSEGFSWQDRASKAPSSRDFTEEQLPPVNLAFYQESESVQNMPEAEVTQWRQSQKMEIIGKGCPKPVFQFAQTTFPAFVQRHLEKLFPKGPSPIQSQGWPLSSSGRDVIASAETGSGKTLAFVLPALEHIHGQPKIAPGQPGADEPVALFLAPTRELAMQIHEETKRFANFYGYRTACVYGGAQNRMEQARSLLAKPHIVIATPGRLLDFVENRAVRLGRISYVVLDEADRMLDMGFEPQVRAVLEQLRPTRQMLMWSATWPKRVQELASSFLKSPIRIKIGSDELSANKNVTQSFIFANMSDRLPRLLDLLKERKGQKILIFSSTKLNAELLGDELYDNGHRVHTIHGDKAQSARTRVLDDFKSGRASVLIATDVAARGIDVSDIQCVINYNLPKNSEDYVHRIGRTGRAGKQGDSISFFVPANESLIPELVPILQESGQQVPPEFETYMAQQARRRTGGSKRPSSYGSSSSKPGSRRPRRYL